MKSNYQFIPEEEKRRIIEMRTNGEKYIVIAEVFNRPIGTIATVWNKHKKQIFQVKANFSMQTNILNHL
jgi:hypothetical protein